MEHRHRGALSFRVLLPHPGRDGARACGLVALEEVFDDLLMMGESAPIRT